MVSTREFPAQVPGSVADYASSMSDNNSGQNPSGWLFNNDERPQQPMQRRPRTAFNFRSVYFWMNVAFFVVLLGLLLGAASQPWFMVVGVAWVVVGVVVVIRSRRNQPAAPNLFDNEH